MTAFSVQESYYFNKDTYQCINECLTDECFKDNTKQCIFSESIKMKYYTQNKNNEFQIEA